MLTPKRFINTLDQPIQIYAKFHRVAAL